MKKAIALVVALVLAISGTVSVCAAQNPETITFYYDGDVEVTVEVYATSPRCVEETYEVSLCSRCDYTTKTLLSSSRITCHS